MSLKQKLISIVGGLLLIIVATVFFFVQYDRAEKAEHRLTEVQASDPRKANQIFLMKFYTSTETKRSFEELRPLLTDRGYGIIFPPGLEELAEPEEKAVSQVDKLTAYENQVTQTQTQFLNSLDISTTFNHEKSQQQYIVQTVLVYEEGEGWKVDDLQFVMGF